MGLHGDIVRVGKIWIHQCSRGMRGVLQHASMYTKSVVSVTAWHCYSKLSGYVVGVGRYGIAVTCNASTLVVGAVGGVESSLFIYIKFASVDYSGYCVTCGVMWMAAVQ